jgi:hypothetical protein
MGQVLNFTSGGSRNSGEGIYARRIFPNPDI